MERFPPLRFRKETRRQRDTRAEARVKKKGTPAFFAGRMLFCPGMETLRSRRNIALNDHHEKER